MATAANVIPIRTVGRTGWNGKPVGLATRISAELEDLWAQGERKDLVRRIAERLIMHEDTVERVIAGLLLERDRELASVSNSLRMVLPQALKDGSSIWKD